MLTPAREIEFRCLSTGVAQQAMHNVILSASAVAGDIVVNQQGEDLGRVEDIMIDLEYGRIAYVVLSFEGPRGADGKLFAIPWDVLSLDMQSRRFILDVNKERLKGAPSFDKHNWPQLADRQWGQGVHHYFGRRPYWEWRFK